MKSKLMREIKDECILFFAHPYNTDIVNPIINMVSKLGQLQQVEPAYKEAIAAVVHKLSIVMTAIILDQYRMNQVVYQNEIAAGLQTIWNMIKDDEAPRYKCQKCENSYPKQYSAAEDEREAGNQGWDTKTPLCPEHFGPGDENW